MDAEQILIIGIICTLLLSGGIVALYYILRVVHGINAREREDAKALETDILLANEITAKAKSVPKEEALNRESRELGISEPDAFAATIDNMPQYTGGDSEIEVPVGVVGSQNIEDENLENMPDIAAVSDSTVLSAMEELRYQARGGNPVAGAIWQIYQAGQLETLEEAIPLGASYSPAQAILLTNGKRWIVLPPKHPENILVRLSADCDAFIVFPDGSSPFLATSLGKHLVDNIFDSNV